MNSSEILKGSDKHGDMEKNMVKVQSLNFLNCDYKLETKKDLMQNFIKSSADNCEVCQYKIKLWNEWLNKNGY